MSIVFWHAKPTAGHDVHGQSAVYDEASGKDVALVYDGKAHADLIAAAPEMAALLRGALDAWRDEMDNDDPIAGSDAVEWLGGFYADVEALIGKIVKDEPVAAEGGA